MNRADAFTSKSISKLIDEILQDTDKLVKILPKSVSKEDVLLVSMFLTMIDIATDINCLVKFNRFLSIPSLIRNFMDTYVDLQLITLDPRNVDRLLYKAYSDDLKALKARINPLHFSLINDDREIINERITKREGDVSGLKELLGTSEFKSIKEKFEKVDLLWFYETIYRDLCSQTHNGLLAIESRGKWLRILTGCKYRLLI